MDELITLNHIVDKLNNYQKEAVLDDSPALLLNAHVGSGKTTVLIAKILHLYLEEKVDLKDMVVLTFTNKAANEIKERLINTGSEDDIQDGDMPFFGTFHSVASKLLAHSLPVERLGYTNDFTIIDPDELVSMADRLIVENGHYIQYKNKLQYRFDDIRRGKKLYGNMRNPDDIEELWEKVVVEKKAQNKMDFDDLIINATKLLTESIKKPKWIIVDEFQDSDRSQLEFIKAMCSPETKLFVVGDPNQIIYTWRGSDRNVFKIFKEEFNAKEMSLPINYRSSSTILDAAKRFLEDQSKLEGVRDPGNRITVKNHYNSFNEAQHIADQINLLQSKGMKYKDIAVFYRIQRQSKSLEEVMKRENIPFEVSRMRSLKDIPVLHWFVSLLKASINKDDKNNIIAVLNNRQFGNGLTHAQIKKLLNNESELISMLFEKMRGFISWCDNKTTETIHEMYNYFELDDYLSPTSSTYMENKSLIIDFIESIKEHIKKTDLELTKGIIDFLNSSALYGLNFLDDDMDIEEDSVKLMTLHACKGLEFKKVYIVGVNPGLLPMRAKSGEEYEEEKRLFFVGITRAMDDLEISYQSHPDDRWVSVGPSPFIKMLPSYLIEQMEEVNSDEAVDLQTIRRKIIENKNRVIENQNDTPVTTITEPQVDSANKKRVKHEKYGEGLIENEDDDTITILFDGYGSRTFTKIFTTMEYL